jgi:hypothetical protein
MQMTPDEKTEIARWKPLQYWRCRQAVDGMKATGFCCLDCGFLVDLREKPKKSVMVDASLRYECAKCSSHRIVARIEKQA